MLKKSFLSLFMLAAVLGAAPRSLANPCDEQCKTTCRGPCSAVFDTKTGKCLPVSCHEGFVNVGDLTITIQNVNPDLASKIKNLIESEKK